MRLLFILFVHLLVTLVRLARPGGVGAVAAESLAVKHQLLIMKRARRRSPNLTLGIARFSDSAHCWYRPDVGAGWL